MTDRREEENIREEIRRSQAAPRRGKRVLTVILTLVVVLGVVVAAAWKDLSSLDSVRRLFSYNKVQQDEQGKAELYSFSNDRSNVFALLGDHLIVASTTNVSVLASDGSVVCSENVKLTTPAIAVGGQTVDIDFDEGVVYVDGVALDEDYVNSPTNRQLQFEGPVTVPEGSVFVLGDNRNASNDSRDERLGCVDERYIIGRVLIRLLPISEFGKVG